MRRMGMVKRKRSEQEIPTIRIKSESNLSIKPKFSGYRKGGNGFIRWCESMVWVPIYPEGTDVARWVSMKDLPEEKNPETGRSYKDLWEAKKPIYREALKMEDGRFIYRLIVFCWPRGEGKSLDVCLIQLWKFFNWPRQLIVLGANSKDQVKFVHFDIMTDIILHSPKLLSKVGGKRNIQEKEIRIKDKKGNIRSKIRTISSFTGIVSNITGYTFSEIFDMKRPKFFVQLDGSTRNMPNALGAIDSTVSDKTHILRQIYNNVKEKKTQKVFFSYRYSREGNEKDYLHPNMSKSQLDHYRALFPFGEFERYFLNLWEAGQVQVFTDEMLEETYLMGINGQVLNHFEVAQEVYKKKHLEVVREDMAKKGFGDGVVETEEKIDEIDKRFSKVLDYYRLEEGFDGSPMTSMGCLNGLGDLLDTDWALLGGLDMADPLAVRGKARSILNFMVKGLPGSRSNISVNTAEISSLKFVYFVIGTYNIEGHLLDVVKDICQNYHDEFNGIDILCFERYAAWDMVKWCEERDIEFEPIFPNYERQREAFREFYSAVLGGRLKAPPIPVLGSKSDDIFREEAAIFYHNQDKRWFGSPEKQEKFGIQDDDIYSKGWCMYGGRLLGPDSFKLRKTAHSFGVMYENKQVLGKY